MYLDIQDNLPEIVFIVIYLDTRARINDYWPEIYLKQALIYLDYLPEICVNVSRYQ